MKRSPVNVWQLNRLTNYQAVAGSFVSPRECHANGDGNGSGNKTGRVRGSVNVARTRPLYELCPLRLKCDCIRIVPAAV